MRYVRLPAETEGYAPLWISGPFLSHAEVRNGYLCCESQRFQALYVDVEWLDCNALQTMIALAQQGLSIVLKRDPKQPGHNPREGYDVLLETLKNHSNVRAQLSETLALPLLRGAQLPWFWACQDGMVKWVFLAHPKARNLKYPMAYGQSACDGPKILTVEVDSGNGFVPIDLVFKPYQSLLMNIENNSISFKELGYIPPPAKVKALHSFDH